MEAEGAAGFFSPIPISFFGVGGMVRCFFNGPICFRRGVEDGFFMVTEFVALHSACKKSGSETMEVSQLHEKEQNSLCFPVSPNAKVP